MSDTTIHVWKGYLLAALFLVANFTQSQCYQHSTLWSVKLGVQMRAALLTLLYRKALVLGPHAESGGVGGGGHKGERLRRRQKRSRPFARSKKAETSSSEPPNANDANDEQKEKEKEKGQEQSESQSPAASRSVTETCANDVVNYMGIDLHRVQDCLQFLWVMWFAPLDLVVVTALLYMQLGWCAFVGLAILLLLVFFQAFVSGAVRHIQVLSVRSRVSLISYTFTFTFTLLLLLFSTLLALTKELFGVYSLLAVVLCFCRRAKCA